MEKTTIYLTTQQKAALADAARTEGRSEARLIRDGIDGLLARHRADEAVVPLTGETSPPIVAPDASTSRPRWIGREEFVRRFLDAQADPSLGRELRDLAPDTTDDLPDR